MFYRVFESDGLPTQLLKFDFKTWNDQEKSAPRWNSALSYTHVLYLTHSLSLTQSLSFSLLICFSLWLCRSLFPFSLSLSPSVHSSPSLSHNFTNVTSFSSFLSLNQPPSFPIYHSLPLSLSLFTGFSRLTLQLNDLNLSVLNKSLKLTCYT